MTDQYQRLKRDGLGSVADILKAMRRDIDKLSGLTPDQLGGTQGRIVVVENKAESAADAAQNAALEAQQASLDSQQATLTAQQAQIDALQAALDAANAQQEIDLSKQVDPSNLFDMRPILQQDASMFWTVIPNPAYVPGGTEPAYLYNAEVPNITAWFDDGFTITAPRANYEIDLGNVTPYKPAGFVMASLAFNYAYQGPWPAGSTSPTQAELGVRSWIKTQGNAEVWSGQNFPSVAPYLDPSSGTYTRVNTSYSMSQGQANLERWRPAVRVRIPNAGDSFTIRGLRAQAVTGTVAWQTGTVVPDYAIADASIVRRMIGPAAVGTTEVGDAAVTDPKIAGMSVSKLIGSITSAMITSLDAAKLTGTLLLARLPAAITGRTSMSATDGQFTNLLRGDGTPWVPDVSEVSAATMFTAVSGFTIVSGSGRRNGNVLKFAGRAQKTSGTLAHGEMVARLAPAYRGGALADQPIPGIVSGGVSGMSGTILRSNSNAVPGAINVIQPPSGNNVIEFDGTIILPAGA